MVVSPLSGSGDCTLLAQISVNEISKRWHDELGIVWLPSNGIDKLYFWRDNTTNFHFYTPAELSGDPSLYQQLQHFSWYYMKDKWEFRSALRILHHIDRLRSLRVLEVGVGRGYFLEQARTAGFSISGIELNPDAALLALQKGFTIYQQDISSLSIESGMRWDVICSFQVLEHLTHPRLFLENALSLLNPSGLLILSVPNSQCSRQLDPACSDLLDQPPHHMSHWDESVFRSLEQFLPVSIREVLFEPLAHYHFNWYIHSWKKQIRDYAGKLPAHLLFNPITYPLIRVSLNAGLRHYVRGHTLMVCLQKTT